MDLLESVGENFDLNFVMKRVSSRQTIRNLVNKLRPMELLIDKTELSAVKFGQHVHLILILVIFSSGIV
jgi:hypothetical protein